MDKPSDNVWMAISALAVTLSSLGLGGTTPITGAEKEMPLKCTLGDGTYTTAALFRLTAASSKPKAAGGVSLSGGVLSDR